jgi:hypothetical protein
MPLLANKRPIDSNDALVRKVFQRLGENEIPRSLPLFEANDSKVCPALALLDCHHPIVL